MLVFYIFTGLTQNRPSPDRLTSATNSLSSLDVPPVPLLQTKLFSLELIRPGNEGFCVSPVETRFMQETEIKGIWRMSSCL